jgi:cyclase
MSSVHLHGHTETMPEPQIKEVIAGVYSYIQLDGSWGLNNPTFLVGKDAVTLVDTCFTEPRSRALRTAIEGVTDKPVRTLLNTHHHGDHTWGNFIFPEATIIGHRLCREATIETGLGMQAFFPGVNWGDIKVMPAFVTFEDRINMYVDDLELQFIFVGPAHTTNDSVVWIPEQKLLIAGDLIFSHCTPFVIQGSLAGHLTALERVRTLGAERVVPGHGDLTGPQAIDDAIAYLRFVQETARKGFDADVTPLEAARAANLGRFGEWHESERLVANIYRGYSEIRGEPLGAPLAFANVFDEMVEFNDGKPIRCFA